MYLLVIGLLLIALRGAGMASYFVGPLLIVLALGFFYEIAWAGSPLYFLWDVSWFELGDLTVDWSIAFDGLTVSLLIPVLTVSALAQLFSLSYMRGDPHLVRFMALLA